MSWMWLHKFGSPKWFFYWSCTWARPLFLFGLFTVLVGLIWGLAFAPQDYQQGNSVRIIYLHVPAAMLAQSCYFALGIVGLVGLVWRIKTAAIFIQAMAPIGAVMAFIALVTGAIWGKTAWGAWWVWDARLTSMLVLFLLYMGIIALQNSLDETSLADKSAAVISLVGLINLPIIKYSVVWWNTLHQGATFTLTDKPAMPASMWLPLLIAVVGFYILIIGLTFWRMQIHILWRERRTNWVKQEVTKHGVY